MNLYINGKLTKINHATNMEELLKELGSQKQYVAVALNLVFLPKSEYKNTLLKEFDQVEIVMPMYGG